MIPLYHDLTDQTVLVFGGGAVGARKAARFARGADVVVVSPAFDDALLGDSSSENGSPDDAAPRPNTTDDAVSPPIQLIRAAPDPDAVRGWVDRLSPVLVVAATDDRAVNAAAESVALDAGILVNRTDVSGDRDAGSVVVPATVDDGPVSVAISTGGASPALSKALRQRIEAEIEGAGAMATLSGELRRELADRGIDPETRRAAIRRVVRSEGVWKGLQKGRSNGRQEAYDVIAEVVDG